MYKYGFVTLILLFFALVLQGQSFGIRAGLNYSKLSGPSEEGVSEKFGTTNGFHFGINYAYKFDERFALKGEIVYSQVGTKYAYSGESFYKIPIGNGFLYEKGNSVIDLKISNAYITVPITAQYAISRKLEINAGVYGGFLIGPRGSGTLFFESSEHPEKVFFKQSLIYSYFQDRARSAASNASGPAIIVDNQVILLPKDAGAYFNFLESEKSGNTFNAIDFGLTGGISYFLNRGFYISVRYDYGLLDLTNNKMDPSRKNFDESENRFLFNNDFDRHVGIQASFGFRF